MGNGLVTFQNTYVKAYHCCIGESDISYPKTINDLMENAIDKPANKKIPMLFNHPKA